MTDGTIRKGNRPDVASFEDEQEAAEIVDFVLIPVYQILNRWIGDPFGKVVLPDDFEADEEKFRSFQRLLEDLDMSDGDSWSLLSLERLKVVCRDIERIRNQSVDRIQ